MSKRRSSERGAGETSGRASKLQCPGISGNNAERAGPFILGKEATRCAQKHENDSEISEIALSEKCREHVCVQESGERFVFESKSRGVSLCVYARLRQECEEFR